MLIEEGVAMRSDYSVRDIIKEDKLIVQFQMIISHYKEFARGVEAFVRAPREDQDDLLPLALFQAAVEQECIMELNRWTIDSIYRSFKKLYDQDAELLLFINVHQSLIEFYEDESILFDLANAYEIPINSIVLDVADYPLPLEIVKGFIDIHRNYGFYISLDDIGKSYFNLDRILFFNPDFIKINQQHMNRLVNMSYRQQLTKHIAALAHEMGIVVVVTGIESEDEVSSAFDKGAQFFQGFYIHHPTDFDSNNMKSILDTTEISQKIYGYRPTIHIPENRIIMNKLVVVLNELKIASQEWQEHELAHKMESIFMEYPSLENGAIINMEGVQVSEARINNEGFTSRNAHIFKINGKGHDYSKDEFYPILQKGTLDLWITRPYTSLLTNRVCYTTYSMVEPIDCEPHIIMLVFNYEIFKKQHL